MSRQYPLEELFNGVMVEDLNNEERIIVCEALPVTPNYHEKAVQGTTQEESKEAIGTEKKLFTNLAGNTIIPEAKERKGKKKEDLEVEAIDITFEQDAELPFAGTTVASWGFAEASTA
ncbi:hypothetical protein [Clostridium thermarum]|uniref:hypothetical protein n=1 Tax=Clostridium thermarum TaxID=1716543 RepID=UPI0011228949|nr:hypothetical protein [Clostridium thermarum]